MASMRKGRKLGDGKRNARRDAEPPATELFEVTAEELAQMHPLVRAAIGAINRDNVQVTTVLDGQGNVLSVKTQRRKAPSAARTLSALLNAIRPLIKMEQELYGHRPPYDLEGTVPGGPGSAAGKGASAPETPEERDFKALYSDMMSFMTYDTAKLDPRGAKPDVNDSSESGGGRGVAVSPDFSPPLSR